MTHLGTHPYPDELRFIRSQREGTHPDISLEPSKPVSGWWREILGGLGMLLFFATTCYALWH